MKNTKKLLALILSFAIIAATIAFNITVTAATQPRYFTVLNTGFDEDTSKDSSFYSQASNGYANDDRSVGLVNSSGIGNNGSSHAMKIGYNNNPSNTNLRPVFSLRCSESYNGRSNTQSFKFVSGYTYKLRFYYKAETVTSKVQLWMRQYGSSLANAQVDTNSNSSTTKLLEISSATDSYQKVEVTFTATAKENLIFLLRPTDYTNVAGTTIYIDDITVMEQQMLESDLGEQDFEDASDMSGFATFEDWAISTDQNHTESGSKSAKFTIEAGDNSGAGRPRMILKVAGNNFIAKAGETYVVSFWVYSPVALTHFNWYIYSQKVSTLTSSRVGQAEIEKSNVALNAGWNKIAAQITIKGYLSSEDNYLQIGLTDADATGAGYGDMVRDFYLDDIKIQEVAQTVTSTPVYQDFTNIGTVSGQKASKSNTNHPAGGGGSAQVGDTGYKSGVSTPQFYIPGDNDYTRLCGEYNKRYRMTVSVRSTSDITAKIRLFGTTILSGYFNSATNHRVIAEQTVEFEADEWTDLTFIAYANVDIFENQNFYFTLGGTVADSGDSSTAYTFLFDNITIREVTKPGTPGAPVVFEHSDDSITLQPLSGGEYSLDGVTWQNSNVFTDLTPWTTYTIRQRKKATETAIQSDPRQLSYTLILNGDLNMDSGINAFDISLLVDVILEAEIEVEYSEPAADVNADDSVDIRDLITIKKMLTTFSNVDAFIPIG